MFDALVLIETGDAHRHPVHVSDARFHHGFATQLTENRLHDSGRFRLLDRDWGYRENTLLRCGEYPLCIGVTIVSYPVGHPVAVEYDTYSLAGGS